MAGHSINRIETSRGDHVAKEPIEADSSKIFDMSFKETRIDDMMLRGELVSIERWWDNSLLRFRKNKFVFNRESSDLKKSHNSI